jgi:PAS domain S-box-containing protein
MRRFAPGIQNWATDWGVRVDILLVDDHATVRNAVRSLLRSRSDWRICGEAADGLEGVEKARLLRPDVVLMDISMPRMDGLEATRILRREIPGIAVIMISQNDPALGARQAAGVDAHGFVSKSELGRQLVRVIDGIAPRSRSPVNVIDEKHWMEHHDPASDRRFRDALDALPAAVCITDEVGHLTYYNSAAIEFSGRIPKIGSDSWCVAWKLFRSDGTPLPHDQCAMAIALKEGRSVYGEETIAERPDGTRRWFQPFPTPVRNGKGRIIGGINMLLDITIKKQGEQTGNLLAAIINSSDDAIISKNLDGVITSWNKSAERIFGYCAAEAVGQHITLIIPPDRLSEEYDIIARLKRGERVDHFDTVRRKKDGSMLDLSLTISPVRDAAGRVIGASKVARDISERKRAEEALAAFARRQRALFQLGDDLLRATTIDDVYHAAMNAICDALDCHRASILLADADGVMRFVAWRDLSDSYRQAAEGHSPWKANEQNFDPVAIENVDAATMDENLKIAINTEGIRSLVFIPLVSHNQLIGKFMTYFSAPRCFTIDELELSTTIARQVSFAIERKRAEEELRSSEERFRNLSETLNAEVRVRTTELQQRNAELVRQSRQLRALSRHQLKAQDEERRRIARELHDSAGQTLTVLSVNLAELLDKTKTSGPELVPMVQACDEMVQQLHQEIRTTSYLLHPPLLDETGLVSALEWYIQGLSARSTLKIHLSIAEDFERIHRDMELAVFRLIQECLTNIHRHASATEAFISVVRRDDSISVEVRDNGKGMSPERLAEVQSGGSGVGIGGMRERVRQFQGEMRVESNPSGTKIVLSMPYLPSPEVKNSPGAEITAA